MTSIEISISNQKYVLRGEEPEEHLNDVAEMVRRRIESIRKKSPDITLHKASILAAFDFASEIIKGRKQAVSYRNEILSRATGILERCEKELASR